MQWKASAHDCLYVNWAVPRETLPTPPRPLRYEIHEVDDVELVFVTALLFHVRRLQPAAWGWPEISFPQLNFRAYALDRQGVPSVLFLQLLMPWWVVPASRLLGRQPARAAHLHFARPSRRPDAGSWRWRALAPEELEIVGSLGSLGRGDGPTLGGWETTVAYFRSRSRVYSADENRLRELEADETSTEPVPVRVEVEQAGLLRRFLPAVEADRWARPHSAWICPEIPVILELGHLRRRTMVPTLTAPTSGCWRASYASLRRP